MMRKHLVQFAVYVLVGATATLTDFSSFVVLTRAAGLTPFFANPAAYLAGNAVSFVGHRRITFRSGNHPLWEYLRFLLVTAAGLGVSQLVLVALIGAGSYDLTAKAAAVLVSGLFNFLANKYWAFRARPKADIMP